MPEIKVKKSRKVSTVIGITFIVLQGLYIALENKYGMVAAANALSDQKAISAGISQTTMLIGDIIGTISFFWLFILGCCFIFLPRIVDKIRQRSDHHAIKK